MYAREVLAGDGAGPLGVVVEHDHDLGCEQRTVAQHTTCSRGVVRRHEVRMSTGGAVARQLEHPGSERGEHPLVDRHRWVGDVERVEIGTHLGERALVHLTAVRHRRLVADAEAEQEAVWMLAGQCGVTCRGLVRRVHPDVEDPSGDGGPSGGGKETGRVAEHVAAVTAGDPDRTEAEFVELGRGLADRRRIGAS